MKQSRKEKLLTVYTSVMEKWGELLGQELRKSLNEDEPYAAAREYADAMCGSPPALPPSTSASDEEWAQFEAHPIFAGVDGPVPTGW